MQKEKLKLNRSVGKIFGKVYEMLDKVVVLGILDGCHTYTQGLMI